MARILFLQNFEFELMGAMYISSHARAAGHDVRIAIGSDTGAFEKTIQDFQPHLLAFSVMTGSQHWALDIARKLKEKFGVLTVFGGPHPTFFPEFINNDGVDMLVRGEGEEAVKDILDCIDAGRDFNDVKNLVFKNQDGGIRQNPLRELRDDLDVYPFPDRHLYDVLDGRVDRGVRNVITSRGCPFHCSYCFEDSLRELYKDKGKFVRLRAVEKVIEELLVLRRTPGVHTIYFSDDIFGLNRKWLYDFLDAYKREIGLPFICLVRADIVAANPEYAKRLADGGCKSVFFGIEAGNEQIRNRVLKKTVSNEQIKKTATHLHDAGIKFRTYNIVGLPDETIDDAFETVKLNIDIKTDYPWCSIFMPLPGTALTEYSLSKGYLPASFEFDSLSKTFFSDSRLNMPDIVKMTNLHKFFQTAVLFPAALPLIRVLIKLRPNPLFAAWFGFIYFLTYVKSENKSFWKTLKFAVRNYYNMLKS